MKQKIDQKLSFKEFLAVTLPILPEDCAELTTNTVIQISRQRSDPLKVFASFSDFVEPISYEIIFFHLVSVLCITADLVKY